MPVPESITLLAGFVQAHAAWSIADVPKGELLVPLAIVEESGQRQLLRFEARTQYLAIEKGKATLAQRDERLDAWAFAREGQFKEDGVYVDSLTVSAKARGMKEPIVFIQRFRSTSKGPFKVIGDAMVVVSGQVLSTNEAAPYLKTLRDGIQSHEKAGPLWQQWANTK